MARVVRTNKVKKKKKIKIVVFVLLGIILLAGIIFCVIKFKPKKETKEPQGFVIIDSVDKYGYTLSDHASAYYKTEFEKLKNLLKEDEVNVDEYVSQLSKMFVIDLYTMSTKINKYDVGGTSYVYPDKKDEFSQKVMDTLYSTLRDNTYNDRKQDLPLVKNSTVTSLEDIEYKLGDKKTACKLVKLTWEYESNMGYDKEGSIVVCPEEGVRWSVVDFQPTLKPSYK